MFVGTATIVNTKHRINTMTKKINELDISKTSNLEMSEWLLEMHNELQTLGKDLQEQLESAHQELKSQILP